MLRKRERAVKFRFEGDEVYIRRDLKTGNVVLSCRPDSWDELFAMNTLEVLPEDFLSAKDRQQGTHDRDPFADPAS